MLYGVHTFPTDYSMSFAEFAKEAEARGCDAITVPEHTHIPASRESPWPGGAELPRSYAQIADPFISLTAAACSTKTLKLVTGVCLVIEHDPIVLAKQVASLDLVSGGRFQFGVGGGWNAEEMANHGTVYAKRWGVLRERIEAMQAIWTQEEASYHGTFVNFERIWSWPKPVQKPHPPIIVGGNGERTFQRVLRYGDEWMPLQRPNQSFGARITELQELAAKEGRGRIPVTIFAASTQPEKLEEYRRDGVYRLIFGVTAGPRDDMLKRLDELARLMADFNG